MQRYFATLHTRLCHNKLPSSHTFICFCSKSSNTNLQCVFHDRSWCKVSTCPADAADGSVFVNKPIQCVNSQLVDHIIEHRPIAYSKFIPKRHFRRLFLIVCSKFSSFALLLMPLLCCCPHLRPQFLSYSHTRTHTHSLKHSHIRFLSLYLSSPNSSPTGMVSLKLQLLAVFLLLARPRATM